MQNVFLEREHLTSLYNIGNPTVRSLRSKKESCSTWRGLHVDSGFESFRQTPRDRGLSLLGFYAKSYVDVSVG